MAFAERDLEICSRWHEAGFRPEVIYDIGASNGTWTRQMRKVFPDAKYEAFEPLADVSEDYKTQLAQHRDDKKFSLHKFALSSEPGVARFQISGERGVGSSLLVGEPTPQDLEVEVETLDRLLERGVLSPPDFIKMDTQGAEMMILYGGRNRAVPRAQALLLETWTIRTYNKQTPLMVESIEYLAREDFYPYDFGGSYRRENGQLVCQDVFFVRRGSDLGARVFGSDLDF